MDFCIASISALSFYLTWQHEKRYYEKTVKAIFTKINCIIQLKPVNFVQTTSTLVCFFLILSNQRESWFRVLVQLMAYICNSFLALSWRLETSSRLFCDFDKMEAICAANF